MIDMLRSLAEAALAPVRHAATDTAARVVEIALAAALAVVGLGFAVGAATVWIAERHGAIAACLVMAAVFGAFAAIALLAHTARERARRRRRRLEAERARAAFGAVATAAAVAGDLGAIVRRGFAGSAKTGSPASPDAAVDGLARETFDEALGLARSGARAVNPWLLIAGAVAAGYAAARKAAR